MRIHYLSFGRLKAPGLREAMDYYVRMAKTWAEVSELELKPLEVPNKSEATRSKIQREEEELFLDKISRISASKSKLILLDERGKNLKTLDWAKMIQTYEDQGCSDFIFAIGSSLGWSESLRQRADLLLSLGAHTLPHELARVVLAEQVFRAMSVNHKHPYHNEA